MNTNRTATLEDSTMHITLGFTVTDRANGYVPTMDGYREGTLQRTTTVIVRDTDDVGYHIAEAAFVATNHPAPESLKGLQREIFLALENETYRSLSVGDTVSVRRAGHTDRYACMGISWTLLP